MKTIHYFGGGRHFFGRELPRLLIFFRADAELLFEHARKIILVIETAALGDLADGIVVFNGLIQVFHRSVQPLLYQKLQGRDAEVFIKQTLDVPLGIRKFFINCIQVEIGIAEFGNDARFDDLGRNGNIRRFYKRVDKGDHELGQIVDDVPVLVDVVEAAVCKVKQVIQVVHII